MSFDLLDGLIVRTVHGRHSLESAQGENDVVRIKNIENRTTADLIEECDRKKIRYLITFFVLDVLVFVIHEVKFIPINPWLSYLAAILCIFALANFSFAVFMRYFPGILKEEYGREDVPDDALRREEGFWEGVEFWLSALLIVLSNLYYLTMPFL
ncbi:hypothetical protein HQN64_05305 [Enterobacteriaceae bacterium BIT-l23]|uniref:hypothetical protein n=1 Tax=Jejubacter sp. L23 TaxID=3092086 RepID=UPI001584B3C4|nr:hypothetical protein [Enterobacteriaceae bacterium BIT-l23]